MQFNLKSLFLLQSSIALIIFPFVTESITEQAGFITLICFIIALIPAIESDHFHIRLLHVLALYACIISFIPLLIVSAVCGMHSGLMGFLSVFLGGTLINAGIALICMQIIHCTETEEQPPRT